MSMRLNDLVTESYEISKSKGWYDGPPATYGDRTALIASEISEALEEFRTGRKPTEIYFTTSTWLPQEVLKVASEGHKPEGIPIELGDAIIRCADGAGGYNFDLEEALWCHKVLKRPSPITISQLVHTPFVHMDELDCVSFGDYCATVMHIATARSVGVSRALTLAETIWATCRMARRYEIDIENAITVKAAFNRTRPYRHGNKVL